MQEVRLTDDPDYKAGSDNLRVLKQQRDELQTKIGELLRVKRKRQPLGAELVVGLPQTPPTELPDSDAAKLPSELAKVENAIKLQEQVLHGMKSTVARKLCRQLVGEYRQRLETFCKMLDAAGRAADAIADFHHFYEGQCGLPLVYPVVQVGIDASKFSAINAQSVLGVMMVKLRQAIGQIDTATSLASEPSSGSAPLQQATGEIDTATPPAPSSQPPPNNGRIVSKKSSKVTA